MSDFSFRLTNWYSSHKRDLPWRNTKNPFKIWLSEIILQQTRVAQGKDYYLKFTNRFQSPTELADADQDEVLKLWQGLGYYSRARNLHSAAKSIKEDYHGQFPKTYNEIIRLKGVGEYTAAAIASFAFDEAHAVVDGNVYRVLSRIFGISTPIDSTQGKKEFKALAYELLNNNDPGEHNQAMMEFGAIQCTPKSPDCSICIFNQDCIAFRNNRVEELPIKEKKTKQVDRFFYYLIIEQEESIFIEQRKGKGIWQGLYQFPLIELKAKANHNQIVKQTNFLLGEEKNYSITRISNEQKHILSHQVIYGQFVHVKMNSNLSKKDIINKGWIEIRPDEFDTFAVPRLIDKYIGENGL